MSPRHDFPDAVDSPELTPAQEDDLITALDEADQGQGVSIDEARQRIELIIKR